MKTTTLGALALAGAMACGAASTATVDFASPTGPINKWLHCSGYGPRSYPRSLENDDKDLAALHLTAARTHDWALTNNGQRIVDTQYIFPLEHLDPPDHARYAESLAGIVRHYTQGWGNGFKWDIANWEIYNEPNVRACWRGTKAEFIDLFVTCLKRLKSEFPHLNIGGPAFAGCPTNYMKELLAACRQAGVAPDFMSWHYYGQNPKDLVAQPARVRKLLDEAGFPKCKTIINEWHYLVTWDGIHGASSQGKIRKAHSGPSAHNGIDSAAFNLTVLAGFQNTCLDQAYYYGSGCRGNWGYKDGLGRFNKSYWSLKIFGDIVSGYADKVSAASTVPSVTTFAGLSADRKRGFVLVSDYRGKGPLMASVKGMDDARVVSAHVLDHTRDLEPVAVEWKDGTLSLPRKDDNSAAFFVVFER